MSLPSITPEVVESVFVRLGAMEVILDADPLEYGPRRLNLKIAEARGHLSRTERMYLQVSQWLQQYRKANRGLQADFDLQMQDLLANDPEVRAGRNVKDRDAVATMKLRTEKEELAAQEIALQDLEAVMTVIKAKRADLKDTQARLRDQIRLCGEEIGLGGRWGSRAALGVDVPDLDAAPHVDATTMRDLQDMFAGVGDMEAPAPEEAEHTATTMSPEADVPESAGAEKEEKAPTLDAFLATNGSDGDVDAFLAALDSAPAHSPQDLDIEELLGDLSQ